MNDIDYKKKYFSIPDVLIRSLWVVYIVINLSQSLGLSENINRLFSYSTFFLSFALIFFSFIKIQTKKQSLVLYLLLVIIMLSFISTLDNIGKYNLNYYVKYLNFICVIFSYFWGSYLKITESTKQFILSSNIILGLLLVLLSIIKPYNEIGQMTLGMSNPNSTGILLFYNLIFNLIAIYNTRKKTVRYCVSALYVCEVVLLFMANSRSTLICSLLIIIIIWLNIKIPKWFILLCTVWPMIFVTIYIYLYQNKIIPVDFKILNKAFFTFRERIWIGIYQLLNKDLWLGHYANFHNEMLHNSHFDLMVQYGIITLIVVVLYLYIIITRLNDGANLSIVGKISLVGILLAIVQGSSESAVLDGGLAAYICTGSLLLFMRDSSTDKKNKFI